MNKEEVIISIVTVCYNSENTLADTIQSILSQSYKRIEYIIIDGGSTDHSVDIIKSYEQEALSNGFIYRWISEPDKGIYDAMNKGIKLCTGIYIGIINSDDWYEPDAIENVVGAITSKEVIITGKRAKYTFQRKYRKTIDNNPNIERNIHRYMAVNHPSTFVPKSIYKKIGLFNTDYQLSADYDFFFRCVKENIPFIKLNTVLANMRDEGATAQSKNLFITAKEDHLIRKENGVKIAQLYYSKKIVIVILLIIRNKLRRLLSRK